MKTLPIVGLVWLGLVLGCSPSSSKRGNSAAVSNSAAGTTSELKFVFTSQQGDVRATARDWPNEPGVKFVSLDPALRPTDGNFYAACLATAAELGGKGRGLFQLQDARLEYRKAVGGNASCWRIHNPEQAFCALPIKDEANGQINAMYAWIE